MGKVRLDQLLVERGLAPSRTAAAAAVLAADVSLGPGGTRAAKPGQLVDPGVEIVMAAQVPYVSRGGIKLANALDGFGVDVSGARCLDVGSATGGFTDCLLRRGASHVVAVDVAYGALHWSLRTDPRVTVMERVNARSLAPGDLAYRPDLIAVDVSFISLEKLLPAVLGVGCRGLRCLALVKPQFEAGREHVGRGGVVRDPATRRLALVRVGRAVEGMGYSVRGFCFSGLPGPAGNRETFILVDDRPGGIADIEAAAREVEPDVAGEGG